MLEPMDQTLNSHSKEHFYYHTVTVISPNLHCVDQRKSHYKKKKKKKGKAIVQMRKQRWGSHKW